jgi:outer membrane autotransporter protein
MFLVTILIGCQASAQGTSREGVSFCRLGVCGPDGKPDSGAGASQLGGVSAGGVAASSPSRGVIEKLLLSVREDEPAAPPVAEAHQMTRNLPDLDMVQSLALFGSTRLVGLLSYEAARQDATARELGFDSDTLSGYGGVSFALGRSAVLGLGAEISRQSGTLSGDGAGGRSFLTYRVSGGEFDVNTFAPSIYYSTGIFDRGYVQLWSSYAFIETDGSKPGSVRSAGLLDGFGRKAGFSVDGREFTLGAQTMYGLDAGRFAISPQLGLEFVRQWSDAFTEAWEPGPVEVRFDSDQASSLQSGVGLSVATALAWRGMTVQPYVALDWIHEYLDDARTIDARVDSRPIAFRTDAPDRDWFELSAEVSFALANGVNASLATDVEIDHRNFQRTSLYGGISIPLN